MEFGNPEGTPLVALHGIPSCGRAFEALDGAARARYLRVIAPDRPGIGASTRAPGHDLRLVVDDLRELVDALDVDAPHLLGFSGGAAYAYAAARWDASAYRSITVVSGTGSPSLEARDRAYTLFDQSCFAVARKAPALLGPALGLVARTATVLGAPVAARRDNAEQWETLQFTFAHGGGGAADDYRATCTPWGFELAAITAPITLFHGRADRIVRPWIARVSARELDNATLHLMPDAGHDLLHTHVNDVLDDIVRNP